MMSFLLIPVALQRMQNEKKKIKFLQSPSVFHCLPDDVYEKVAEALVEHIDTQEFSESGRDH